jgi:glutathione S-transferase
MITLHLLAYSRAIRIVWLLEALGVEYEIVRYERDEEMRAPPELKAVHPLGKSPVIVDGDLTLAESATILRYIHDRHGEGRFTPPAGSAAHALHEEWLDFVESSAALPVLVALLDTMRGGVGPTMQGFAGPMLQSTLAYIAQGIGDKPFLMGDEVMLADIQLSYLLVAADAIGALAGHPQVAAYCRRLQAHPGFVRAVEVAGPMMAPRG